MSVFHVCSETSKSSCVQDALEFFCAQVNRASKTGLAELFPMKTSHVSLACVSKLLHTPAQVSSIRFAGRSGLLHHLMIHIEQLLSDKAVSMAALQSLCNIITIMKHSCFKTDASTAGPQSLPPMRCSNLASRRWIFCMCKV